MALVTCNRWDGGKAQDLRTNAGNTFYVAQHFDIRANPHKLNPLRAMEEDSSGITSNNIRGFAFTPSSGLGTSIFGLGRISSGDARGQIFTKGSLTTAWTTTSGTNTSVGSTVVQNTLQRYGPQGINYLYYLNLHTNGTSIIVSQYNVQADSFTDSVMTLANGQSSLTNNIYPKSCVHSQDNKIYFGAYNKIGSIDNSFTTADISTVNSITFPPNYYQTSICEYGNFLAYALRDVNGTGNSRVFLWDRDTSQTTFNQSIDWGDGDLMVVENIYGYLVGVSVTGSTIAHSNYRIMVKIFDGVRPVLVKEIYSSTVPTLYNYKDKINDQLVFAANLDSVYSLYVLGKNTLGEWYLTEAYVPSSGTTSIDGFGLLGDVAYVAYDNAGAIKRSNDTAGYADNSTLQSTINPNMPEIDRLKPKALRTVKVSCAPLPSGGSLTLSVSVDGAAYAACSAYSTTGGTGEERMFDANGAQFAQGTEFQFKVVSTGGAAPTAITYDYEPNDSF